MFGQTGSSPFDLSWRMFGISVRIKLSFWIFAVLFGIDFLMQQRFDRFAAWVGCLFASFLLKELGHVLVGRVFGVRGGIVLGFGSGAVGPYETMHRWQRIVFHAAAPAMSFALWYGAW